MGVPQIPMQGNVIKSQPRMPWMDPFLIPVYLALGLLVIQALLALQPFKRIRELFESQDSPQTSTRQSTTSQAQSFFAEAKRRIGVQGRTTFLLNLLRLLGTLTLAGLTITAFLMVKGNGQTKVSDLGTWSGTDRSKLCGSSRIAFTCDEWTEVVHLAFYCYASILAFITLVSQRRWRSAASIHLTLTMLAVVAVYTYRDLYPLATFTLVPKDASQGWLLWSRIGVVMFVGVLIPLITPRTYYPVDASNPAKHVNSEQTASWLSFLTFSFLDPVIWLAAFSPHLEYESLPPLADYDASAHLVAKSKMILDPFIRQKKTHLFWGLMQFFASEFIQLAIMLVLRAFAGFLAPLGINRLLNYIETNGEHSFVRPWVWILCLFLGPAIVSVTMQYYIFINTRTLVRTEGIITQLVFDHALRIRLNDDTEPNRVPTSVPDTPETQPITEGEGEGGSADSGEETSQGDVGSSMASSAKTLVAKDKRKDTGIPDTTIPATTPGPDGVETPTGSKSKASNIVGKINNYVTTDLGNITDGREFLMLVVYGPLRVALCIWFLYEVLGWSALVGTLVLVLSLPIPGFAAKMMQSVQKERMTKTDSRVQKVTEILSVIRMVKLFGWEQKVGKQMADKRETELLSLKKRQLLNLLNSAMNFIFPCLTMFVTFGTYTTIQGMDLRASTLFSAMPIFDMLRGIINEALFFIPRTTDAKVSLDRINDFLLQTELLDRFARKNASQEEGVYTSQNIDSEMIGFRNATFAWDGITKQEERETTPSRRSFRLSVEGELFFRPQKLNLVIGPTGSGKTSLLMALLGEMHYEPNGEAAGFNLPRSDGVAYAAQEAWVQSETIRENILFGKPYEKERYDKVIYQCGLERDLSLFEAGDATAVGEKGLTLSGGQKARVTLARAVYSDAKILLLDDMLAALDVHTAKFVVEKCLQGDLLRDRTVIIVTHNVAMVTPIADFVVSLDLNGRIASQGTVSDALTRDHQLLQEVTKTNEVIEKAMGSIDGIETAKEQGVAAKLVIPEEIPVGHVGWPALKLYFSSLGGILFWVAVLGGFLMGELSLSFATWFLGYWASQYDGHPGQPVRVGFYLSMYSLIMLSVISFITATMAAMVLGSIKASRTVHQKLITSILGTTLRWLDTVPTARIIARCTQDIRAVDGPISQSLAQVLELTMALAVGFCSAVLFVPVFILPGIAVFVVGGACGQLYMKAQLSIKREMSNRRSPVLAHFGAAISGLTSIRAYNAQSMFQKESLRRIDGYTRPARSFYNCNRWVSIRIDAIGGLFASGLAAVIVYGHSLRSASNTGFSLTMAIGFSSLLLWWVRFLNEFEVQGNSLERIEGYINIEQEPKSTETGRPPAYWPASGSLRVENLFARYSSDGPQVLHDISFEIKSGERVGIVGRTGSGKSSLTLSLLRCIPTEGHVTLDGLPTDSINLDALRSSVTIIPQQPELLSGTLRENLDPFSEHPDSVLNDALRSAGLFNLQDENDLSKITLDSSVSSGGGNLSVGQRQILALARAIVRQSKLLILDEATSAVDYATDTVIQETLRKILKDATLITVAHRLQTVMDADKILVLDAGKMVEFDSPANLLKNSKGYFRSLVDESGDREVLWEMAQAAKNPSASSGL